MNRRQFLRRGAGFVAASSLLGGCTWPSWALIPPWLPVKLIDTGQQMGHRLRDLREMPPIQATRTVDTLILGSGVAGLTAAWRLYQQGHTDVLMLTGTEWMGNASRGQWSGLSYPRGAHYLPFPTAESSHVIEMLRATGVLQGSAIGQVSSYDERVVVHALSERVWAAGEWHEGLLPPLPVGSVAEQQVKRFFQFTDALKGQRGEDGRLLFAIPVSLSSMDRQWQALDQLRFADWLTQQGYDADELLWYLDYCCRDDYGAGMARVSAWAGLHYFASRVHEQEGADQTSILTWPDGLHGLTSKLYQQCQTPTQPLTAIQVRELSNGAQVLAMDQAGRVTQFRARKVICAMPLHALQYVWSDLFNAYQGSERLLPQYPWLVANVWIDGALPERHGEPLAWENAIYGSESLGFVNATHQRIGQAKPKQTVLTCYHALANRSPEASRLWLSTASVPEMLDLVLQDVFAAYGTRLWSRVAGVELCVRGHAMSAPSVGFRSHRLLNDLRHKQGAVLVAHSDLSGYSVFEEASYWGWQAAEQVLS
ncbi:MAG: NAD(P)-binding protein [Pseudomonadota bacterium]|nr:NAD(P)-binding protein [Pseudomonadota bacterium]